MSETNKKLCDGCDECCRYVAIEIDSPEEESDYQNIIWYLLHEDVNVFIDWEDCWFVEFITPCFYLNKTNGLCKRYSDRPDICRQYNQVDCTKHNNTPAERKYFKTVDDFEIFLKNKK